MTCGRPLVERPKVPNAFTRVEFTKLFGAIQDLTIIVRQRVNHAHNETTPILVRTRQIMLV